jgi:RNA polymerase sigma-70 factor (ECF subfamily)
MNELRRGKTEAEHVSMSDPLPEVPVGQALPDEDGESTHAIKSMHECLKELKPHVRYVVLLRHQGEQPLTYEEMGRICREQPKTLQVRVARALPVLRRCLERKGVTL